MLRQTAQWRRNARLPLCVGRITAAPKKKSLGALAVGVLKANAAKTRVRASWLIGPAEKRAVLSPCRGLREAHYVEGGMDSESYIQVGDETYVMVGPEVRFVPAAEASELPLMQQIGTSQLSLF